MWRRVSVLTTSILLGLTTNGWTANQFCRSHFNTIDENTLYAVSCAVGKNCISRVVSSADGAVLEHADGSTSYLERGHNYHFIYKLTPTVAQNSLVVVQIKRLDSPARTETLAANVNLKRKAISFGCRGFSKSVSLGSWPAPGVSEDHLPSVAYDNYDQFHRFGYTGGDSDRMLRDNFHVRYNNGNGCVWTMDMARRWQFLIEDRTNVSGKIAAFFARVGLYTPTANAAALDSVKKYEKLKVLVTNYSSNKDEYGKLTPACFGFSAAAGAAKTERIDVSISDVESLAALFPFDGVKEWSFNVK